MRSQKPYSPREDVAAVVSKICEKHSELEKGLLGEGLKKFKILKECSETLSHTVPNSLLHKINTISKIKLKPFDK